ncbi:rhomboid family intramembrane serine protease [uncultured Kocuria sp.]|uniref:rhomboid family intramembrane serine protease n=1 Tax=uncultured Kocuria sp. TaxID=259305 RepID=UPI0025F5BC8B|nr:rhomboid family intramembrane serine protease [uncultured Kocuria sp.]
MTPRSPDDPSDETPADGTHQEPAHLDRDPWGGTSSGGVPRETPASGSAPGGALPGGEPVPAPQYGQYLPGHGAGNPRASGDPYGTQGPHGVVAPGPHDPRCPVGAPARRRRTGMPVTWWLIGICVGVWGAQWLAALLTPYSLVRALGYVPSLTWDEPWRMLTSGFIHSMPSPLHLLLNMYTLYLFGRMLEPLLGTWRMLVLFLLSVLGGSVGVLLLGDPWVVVIGASGGIFGLFGAMFVFMRHFKNDMTPIVVLIVVNLAFGFVVGGIAWQAHVGGLVVGGLVALAMLPGLRRSPLD